MKKRGRALRMSSTEPSVEPESMTSSSQFRYSCASSAGSVSRNAQASLNERMMIVTVGSLIGRLVSQRHGARRDLLQLARRVNGNFSVRRVSQFRIAGHQPEHVRNGLHVGGNFRLIGA